MNIRPLRNMVLVQRIMSPSETLSGIALVTDGPDVTGEGTVLEIGPDADQVKVGDVICFGKYAGQTVAGGDPNRIMMPETDIFFVKET